jgi:predicted RNA-binding Zn ribbon-like protein
MKHRLPVIEQHVFRDKDFVGGDLVLDFVNTVTGRNGRPRDWIASFAALADWAVVAGLLPARRCERLKNLAQHAPAEATSALEAARDLREMLFRVLTDVISSRNPSAADLKGLHRYWSRGVEQHMLRPVLGAIELVPLWSPTALNGIADVLAVRSVDLFRELSGSRVRLCAGPNCAWLFIDSSKAGRRRWCDMATCGNDAKARRHYYSKRRLSVRNVRKRIRPSQSRTRGHPS